MRKQIKTLGLLFCMAIILAFTLFVINQVVTVYANLATINLWLAKIVTALIVVVFAILTAMPVILFLRLPKAINHPEDDSDIPVYRKILAKRLKGNRHLSGLNMDLSDELQLEKALQILNARADSVVQKTASSVFLTTAISQNGKLDALTVFLTQTRMIWQIAHIYWQRPALKDMFQLYANVGATTFLATEIEEMDLSRQIEPILNAIFKSPGKSIPIVGHATNLIMDSVLEGSVNAFLTLRIGIISKRYCGAMETFNKNRARRYAFVEASEMLKSLVVKSSGQVISSLIKATKRTGVNTVKSGINALEKAAKNLKDNIGDFANKRGNSKKETNDR